MMTAAINHLPERALLGHIVADPSLGLIFLNSGATKAYFTDENLGSYWESIRAVLPQDDTGLASAIHRTNPRATMAILGLVGARLDFTFESAMQIVTDYGKKLKLFNEFSMLYSELVSDHNKLKYQDILIKISAFTDEISRDHSVSETPEYPQVLDEFAEELEKKVKEQRLGKPPGIRTGIEDLDKTIHGWMPTGFYVVGARTSLGKTTLAINFADAALRDGKKVLFFTNEMKRTQITGKHMSLRTAISGSDVHQGLLSDEQLSAIGGAMYLAKDLKFFIDHDHGTSLVSFENEIKKFKRKHNVDLVILDYIQQLRADDSRYSNRAAELSEISGRIKDLAVKLDLPIICLAQLNRTAENSDEIPNISQIKDCGSIEQDADMVMLIHRDRHEHPNSNGEVPAQLVIGKSRFSRPGILPLMINFEKNKFR